MKIKWSEERTAALFANLIVVVIGVLIYLFFSNYDRMSDELNTVKRVLFPFCVGFVIAFLLAKPVNKMDSLQRRYLFKAGRHARLTRNLSIFLALVVFLMIIFFLLYITLPELSRSLTMLLNSLPSYLEKAQLLLTRFINYLSLDQKIVDEIFPNWTNSIYDFISYLAAQIPSVISYSWRLFYSIFNLAIGVIVAAYLLASKEKLCAQIKKVLMATAGDKKTARAGYVAGTANTIFNDFIVGKILDSAIIGIICFIGMSIMNMPYTLLISVVIGITNIIPFFGPFIGAIPSAFLILLVDPVQMVIFVIFIFLLQQFDGNILGPFILGDATGLDSLWVVVAILIGGGLFGFVGMVIGVPTLAVCYILFKEYIEKKLQARGMPPETANYYPGGVMPPLALEAMQKEEREAAKEAEKNKNKKDE